PWLGQGTGSGSMILAPKAYGGAWPDLLAGASRPAVEDFVSRRPGPCVLQQHGASGRHAALLVGRCGEAEAKPRGARHHDLVIRVGTEQTVAFADTADRKNDPSLIRPPTGPMPPFRLDKK